MTNVASASLLASWLGGSVLVLVLARVTRLVIDA